MFKRLNNEKVKASLNESKIHQDENGSKDSSDLSSAAATRNYGSTPVQEKPLFQFYIPCCGLILYIMTFLGICCAFLLRVSICEAIVAAVNTTALDEEVVITLINVSTDDQCPRDPELMLLNGELIWSRYQQGMVLAAFYYGHEFTQVCNEPLYNTTSWQIWFVHLRSSMLCVAWWRSG